MKINLFQIYESLESMWEMLLEHNSTQRSRINKLSNDIMRDWLNWVKQKMQSKKLPWLAGLDFNNNYHCVLGFFLFIQNELDNGVPLEALRENNTFEGAYPIEGDKVKFVVWPGDDSGQQGMTHIKDIPVWIEIDIANFDECLYDVFGDDVVDDSNTEPIVIDNAKLNQTLQFYLMYRRMIISHESQHYIQHKTKWKEHKTALDYGTANDIGQSVFSNILYLATPQEVEANLTGAYRIYRYYHKKLDILQCLFIIYSQGYEQLVMKKFLKDDFVVYDVIYRHFPDLFFIFAWIVYYYIPKKANRPWLVKMVEEALPKHEDAFKRYNLLPDARIVRDNAKNLFKFIRALRHDERFYPVRETLESVAQDKILASPEDTARIKEVLKLISDRREKEQALDKEVDKKLQDIHKTLFSVNKPNDTEISNILSLYTKRVSTTDNSRIYSANVDSMDFFPDRMGFLARFCNKKICERIFIDAVRDKYADPKCPDLFSGLFDLVVNFNSNKYISLTNMEYYFARYATERPARLFIFLYIVLYYIRRYQSNWLPALYLSKYKNIIEECGLPLTSIPYRNRAAAFRRWFKWARKQNNNDPTFSDRLNDHIQTNPKEARIFIIDDIGKKKKPSNK